MRKITDILQKIKKTVVGEANFWLLAELAAVILIITVAVNYVFNYVGNSIISDRSVPSWEYIYTNDKQPPTDNSAEWSTANSFTPMSKEKTGKYLHMRGSIGGAAAERRLIINADYAPMQIALNGEAVYNNHYGESEYVGNRYNAVVLPAADSETEIEISVCLPFSAEITTEITGGAENPGFTVNGGLVFAFIMLALGIAALFAAAFLPLFKRKRAIGFGLAGLTLIYGVAALLQALTGATYFINFPQFYNISAASEIIPIIIFTVVAASVLEIRDKKIILFSVLGTAAAAATFFIPNVFITRIGILSAAVLLSVGTAVCAYRCAGLLSRRIQYSGGFFIMLTFLSGLNALCGVMQLTLRYRSNFTHCRIIGELVFLGFISFILSAKAFARDSADTARLKTETYDKCVGETADIMADIISRRDKLSVCKAAADGVIKLCSEIFTENAAQNIAFEVSVKENGSYRQIYNSLPGGVNYEIIEKRCAESGRLCVFADAYFDFVFTENGNPAVFFHFENLSNGLSHFFTSIMDTVYTCTEVALSRFSQYEDTEKTKIEAFTQLAADTETAAGNNPDHIECVAYYTRVIMEKMGYPEQTVNTVSAAAMLHDIGKTAIPPEITNKTGLLSESEREIIKKHTEYGRQLLSVFDGGFMRCAAEIAAEHHERWDGRGYNGIAGENINEYARIAAVADTIDALTTKRSYKEAWQLENAVDYIDSNSGIIYDPKAVSAMHECLDEIKAKVAEKNK